MKVTVQIPINAPKDKIWNIITDIEHAAENMQGIQKIEIHEKPAAGLVGLKWTETRMMFGKEATETMWITDAEENRYYMTRAESHGAVYQTKVFISEESGSVCLGYEFSSEAQTFGAKIMAVLFGVMAKSSVKKAFLKDLYDIKRTVERE